MTREREFEDRLKALESNARRCAVFAYTDFTQHYFEDDTDTLDRLNRHAGFWNAIRAAMQDATLISLARLFDRDPKNYSIAGHLRFADTYRGIFSRASLKARKMRFGMPSEAAEQYASEAYELRPGGLAQVKAVAHEMQEFYNERVGPIRHTVVAHAVPMSDEERDRLFERLPTRRLEKLCVFPLQVHRCLFRLYYDGIKPVLDDAPSLYANVLKAIPGRHVNTWEHLHAVKAAKDFFDWFKSTPLDDDDE